MVALTINTLCRLLLGVSSTFASPLLTARQHPVIIYGTQAYYQGPYLFLGCSAEDGQSLVSLFGTTRAVLENHIIPAVQTPSQDPNQDPFVTFFSSNSRNTVQNVFKAIQSGATVNGGGTPIQRPRFICANEVSGPYIGKGLEMCTEACARTNQAMAYTTGPLGGSTDVFLCECFFNYPQFPHPSVNCPFVNFTFNSAIFYDHRQATRNQFSIIIHELAHIYSPHPITYDIYDLNLILYQTLDIQLNNARNYDYYAALVALGCKTFPYLQNRHSTLGKLRGREELPAMLEPIKNRLEGRQTPSTLTNSSIVPLADSQQYTLGYFPLSSMGNFDFYGLERTVRISRLPPGYATP